MERKVLFTSESVSEGHPDKLCDQVADSILDQLLAKDPKSRVAIEVLMTTEKVVVAGEVTTHALDDKKDDEKIEFYKKTVRDVLTRVGYTSPEIGIGASTCDIEVLVKTQSNDISMGVDKSFDTEEMGAGDQGIMFGYACDETDNYMPLPIVMAHKLVRYATNLRKQGKLAHSRPDMKAQVTVDYTNMNKPRVDTIVFSCQHDEDVEINAFRKEILENVLIPVSKSFNMNTDFKYFINPTGRFVIGGPMGDTGVTGRKIIVDTYGGSCPHGGGAFSGKDPSKVDRSAAYAARHCAKNVVASKLASRCQIQLSYAIGVSAPISISIETFGTEKIDKLLILEAIENTFDFTPGGIIKRFSLTKPSFKYADISNYGHFGRPDLDLPFEKLDYVDKLLDYVNSRVK